MTDGEARAQLQLAEVRAAEQDQLILSLLKRLITKDNTVRALEHRLVALQRDLAAAHKREEETRVVS
jgi:hypothetical protein